MTREKFSHGPWRTSSIEPSIIVAADGLRCAVAALTPQDVAGEQISEERAANARLIAAAPALYEALKAICDLNSRCACLVPMPEDCRYCAARKNAPSLDVCLARGQAALAKAVGE